MFAAVALDLDDETFVRHVVSLASSDLSIGVHPSQRAQIASLMLAKPLTKSLMTILLLLTFIPPTSPLSPNNVLLGSVNVYPAI